MFTRQQLEMIEDVLDGKEVSGNDRKALSAAVHSALWIMSRPLPRKDANLVEQAIADGRLQIFQPPKPGEPESITALRERLTPPAKKATDGLSLLAALGLAKRPEPAVEETSANEEAA